MQVHSLKTVAPYFDEAWSGNKSFEVRVNDRGFLRWDRLELCEYDLNTQSFTGRKIECVVSYILYGGQYGITDSYCVMSLSQVTRITG